MVEVVLGEALNNGIRASMDVRVKMNLIGKRLVIRIKDGGDGFCVKEQMEALTKQECGAAFEERLLDEGGRGILIMTAWMDRVIYNRKGNEVLLVKRLDI